jgi:ActR/RegA family two-component response regulator
MSSNVIGPAPPRARRCVLVLDDYEPILRAWQRYGRGSDVHVCVARDVMQACDQLQAYEIDTVVADLRLRGGTSVAFLRGLADTRPELRLIVITGDDVGARELLAHWGVSAEVFLKPVDFGSVIARPDTPVAGRSRGPDACTQPRRPPARAEEAPSGSSER